MHLMMVRPSTWTHAFIPQNSRCWQAEKVFKERLPTKTNLFTLCLIYSFQVHVQIQQGYQTHWQISKKPPRSRRDTQQSTKHGCHAVITPRASLCVCVCCCVNVVRVHYKSSAATKWVIRPFLQPTSWPITISGLCEPRPPTHTHRLQACLIWHTEMSTH